jgi:hypothetical protein
LKNLSLYLKDSDQAVLADKMNQFRQEITHSREEAELGESEGCLASKSALKDLPFCKKNRRPRGAKKSL